LSSGTCARLYIYKFFYINSRRKLKTGQVWHYLQKDWEYIFKSNRAITCYDIWASKNTRAGEDRLYCIKYCANGESPCAQSMGLWKVLNKLIVACGFQVKMPYLFSIVIYKIMNLFYSQNGRFRKYVPRLDNKHARGEEIKKVIITGAESCSCERKRREDHKQLSYDIG